MFFYYHNPPEQSYATYPIIHMSIPQAALTTQNTYLSYSMQSQMVFYAFLIILQILKSIFLNHASNQLPKQLNHIKMNHENANLKMIHVQAYLLSIILVYYTPQDAMPKSSSTPHVFFQQERMLHLFIMLFHQPHLPIHLYYEFYLIMLFFLYYLFFLFFIQSNKKFKININ